MEHFRILEGEGDVALKNYAQTRLVNSKCDWQSGILDHIFRFYNKETKRVAVDGGANYGFVSNGLAQHFEEVYSFEVNPDILDCLSYNTSYYTNIKVIDRGLYNAEGIVSLSSDGRRSGMVRIGEGDLVGKVTTLDSLNLERVDFIKLDVEGSEYEALLGSIETIKRTKPVLYFEWNTQRTIKDELRRREIFELLDSLGYKFRDHRHYDFLFSV